MVASLSFAFLATAAAQLTNYSHVHTFKRGNEKGTIPYAGLREGSDGALYGITSEGGRHNAGTLFRLNKDGSVFTLLHHFGAVPGDGRIPREPLIQASDGYLYGVTTAGGWSTNSGTVFRIAKSGANYQILHRFFSTAGDGAAPVMGLIEASDGVLYGVGGIIGAGLVATIFKMDKDGSHFAVVHEFWGPDEPYNLRGPLVEGTNGMLYAASESGGDYGAGTAFRVNKDGSGFSIIDHFGGFFANGFYPSSGLMLGRDGYFYFNTLRGGALDQGMLAVVNHDGSSSGSLHSFQSITGMYPQSELIEGQDDWIYGTAEWGGTNNSGVVFKVKKDTLGYTVLHRFDYRALDGAKPSGGVIQGSDGWLYGTTSEGGTGNRGTIYKLQTNGFGYAVLKHFDGEGERPAPPVGALVEGSDGRFYGAADQGGAFFKGAIFRVNRDGSDFAELHSFGAGNDGVSPRVYLLSAKNGCLYGTTASGGMSNAGTIFQLEKNGSNYSVLHHFSQAVTNGAVPSATLMEASDGYLYGTTSGGGSNGWGIIYRVATNGSFTALRSFTSASNDVRWPSSPLVEGMDGWLYGVARSAFSSSTARVFRLNKDGSGFTNLASFYGGQSKGDNPTVIASLMEASDGWLYGTVNGAGTTNAGLLFTLNKSGEGFSIIHDFLGAPTDGAEPHGRLVEGRDGALYGTTYLGGASSGGTLFKVNKDGGGCVLLHSYAASGAGGYRPELPLVASSDSALYGMAPGVALDPQGDPATAGFIFRLGHSLELGVTNGLPLLKVTGLPGYEYDLEFSFDLNAWTNAATFFMSGNAAFEFTENNAPPTKGFYRVRAK